MILYILQNAYKSEKHQFKNRDEWSKELKVSHTGRRLQEMIPRGADFTVINASGIIGDNPDSCYDADLEYIMKYVDAFEPSVICACGRIAQEGCKRLGLEFIPAPHPAWRRLSKKDTKNIRNEIGKRHGRSNYS